MKLSKFGVWPVLVVALAAPTVMSCSSAKDLAEAAQGCDEFKAGAKFDASLNVDANVRVFMQASADLSQVAGNMKAAVKTACANMATDLGADDTWTAKGDSDDAVTEACSAASAKINAIMQAGAQANVTFALSISGGQCTVDAQAQANCEASCQVDASCKEPDISVRCDPGELSGQCSGTCNANATCEGSASVEADCQGSCSATCTGTCSGECNGTVTGGCSGTCEGKCDGQATPDGGQANCAGTCEGRCTQPAAGATCSGKCSASCTGKCSGECKLDANANISCGANVNCKGGCSVAYTAPSCEGELKPPTCQGDANCQGSCSGSASVNAHCTPPQVELVATGNVTTDIDKLIATVKTNLPALLLAAETQGKLAISAAGKVVAAGEAVVKGAGSLGGKAIACATVAAKASVAASASVNVSVQASASASGSVSSGSK